MIYIHRNRHFGDYFNIFCYMAPSWRPRHLRSRPNRPVLLVVIGCGGQGASWLETATPSMILYFVDAMILEFVNDIWFLRPVRMPPSPSPSPLPFLVQPYVSQHPPYKNEGVFVVVPLALPSAGPPCIRSSWWSNKRLTSSVIPRPPPPRIDVITASRTCSKRIPEQVACW